MGSAANAPLNSTTALGVSAAATGLNSTALGTSATASATYSIAFGQAASATHIGSVAFGQSAATQATKQFVTGSAPAPINELIAIGDTTQSYAPQAQSSTAALRPVGRIAFDWATSTDASRKSRTRHYVRDAAGERETFREESDGAAAMLGFYGGSAVAKQTVTGAKGGNAALTDLLTKLAALGLITDSTS